MLCFGNCNIIVVVGDVRLRAVHVRIGKTGRPHLKAKMNSNYVNEQYLWKKMIYRFLSWFEETVYEHP
jgi:hypothetical protein